MSMNIEYVNLNNLNYVKYIYTMKIKQNIFSGDFRHLLIVKSNGISI